MGFADSAPVRYILANGNRVLWADEIERLGPAGIRWSLPDGKSTVAASATFGAQPHADDKNAY
jgi:hypothetical protein